MWTKSINIEVNAWVRRKGIKGKLIVLRKNRYRMSTKCTEEGHSKVVIS